MTAVTIFLVVCLAVAAYGIVPQKIVGGNDAPIGKYPYQVSIRESGKHFCGGSVINKRYILTAAHCIPTYNLHLITLHVGKYDVYGQGYVYYAEKYIVHTGYNTEDRFNDIGLIRVNTDIVFDDRVQPIKLDSSDSDWYAEVCLLPGWGQTREGQFGRYPQHLQELGVRVVSQSQCTNTLNKYVDWSQICTYNIVGQGACYGDSGGPLVCGNVQIGIVSFGYGCATKNPDIYTRVSAFLQWINENQTQ